MYEIESNFWIYSYAIINFQVVGQYFQFCKKILSFLRSLSAVSGLGEIMKLYLLQERPTIVESCLGSVSKEKQNRNQVFTR